MTQLPFPIAQRMELERKHFPNGVNAAQIAMLNNIEKRLAEAYKAGYEQSSIFGFHEWSNNTAMGYAIMAMERLDFEYVQIKRVIKSMYRVFDGISIEQARQHYNESTF
ncbi:hypothetical protein C1I60_12795 [Paenibacillus terrae]|uniref:Uncharacterized protein n=1 Tax=Paenibacillus terrae TaxID=159743 RepID=A0A4U2PWF1_9BACL|nr:hypothetical protein [Paenibacillus terrae]TKH44202.1 hypothetical protein C1I60_12795 [Paenibacillus terrae]